MFTERTFAIDHLIEETKKSLRNIREIRQKFNLNTDPSDPTPYEIALSKSPQTLINELHNMARSLCEKEGYFQSDNFRIDEMPANYGRFTTTSYLITEQHYGSVDDYIDIRGRVSIPFQDLTIIRDTPNGRFLGYYSINQLNKENCEDRPAYKVFPILDVFKSHATKIRETFARTYTHYKKGSPA